MSASKFRDRVRHQFAAPPACKRESTTYSQFASILSHVSGPTIKSPQMTPLDGETVTASLPGKTSAAKKPRHSLFETIVFVDVGPEPKRFAIHKGLLCSRSGYFKAALTGNFREAEDQLVTLDDEDPRMFRRFNAWLYTDVLIEDGDTGAASWSSLIDMYVFAEKRIIPHLQNAVIDSIIRLKDYTLPASVIRYGWTRTAGASPLRKLFVDTMLTETEDSLKDEFQNNIEQYDITFVAAVALRAAELITLELDAKPDPEGEVVEEWLNIACDPWREGCRRYHIHEPSEPRCNKMEDSTADELQ